MVVTIQKKVTHNAKEYYPFFSWSLFSHPIQDKNYLTKSYLHINSVDGQTLGPEERVYTVGTSGVRLQKHIKALLNYCKGRDEKQCESKAIEWLSLYFNDIIYSKNITFTASFCHTSSERYTQQMQQGLTKFPKFVDCEKSTVAGPFSLGRAE
jgi:hypothetical protein